MKDTTVRTETITIDGVQVEAPSGELLIHVIRRQGIDLPTLCHDDRLAPYGSCRLCVVSRTDGRGGMVTACSTPVQSGMIIETESEEVVASRRRQLQLLALNHRMECPVCDRRGDCRFQDLIFRYGTPEQALPFDLVRNPRNEVSPVISRDPEKCILCGRCVRLCDEVQGVAAIGIMHRGLQAKVGTLLDRALDCEFCGQCVNACPVGALVARPHLGEAPVHLRKATTTTCGFCSCGCQLRCEVYDGVIQRVSSDEKSVPNSGKLCTKGWLGQDVHHNENRLTKPLIRRDGELVEASWDEALNKAAAGLEQARTSGRAMAGIGSARLTTEDAYQMQYFLRAVLGSPHVGAGDSGGREALINGLKTVTGGPQSTATFEDLAAADTVVVLRADPGRTHPLVKTELMRAMHHHGQRVFLASATSGGFSSRVTDDLQLRPGTEAALLAGAGQRLLATRSGQFEGASDISDFKLWSESVAAYTPEATAGITGLSEAAIDSLTTALGEAENVVFVVICGAGISGSESVTAGAAASLATLLQHGEHCRAGVLLLGEKANTQGVLNAGLDPELLPGWHDAADADNRSSVETVCSTTMPSGPGWSASEVVEQAAAGNVGLLYLAGHDPERSHHDSRLASKAIESADFVIVHDAFLTSAAARADVVFPIAILAERCGSIVSADGVTRSLQPVMEAPERAPQDGQIFAELARRMGFDVPEGDTLHEQLSALVADPAPTADPKLVIPPQPPAPSAEDRFYLDISPQLFHSGFTTWHSKQLCSLSPSAALRMAPADADSLGIAPGQSVRVASNDRELILRARVDETVRPGTVASITNGEDQAVSDLVDTFDNPTFVSVRESE